MELNLWHSLPLLSVVLSWQLLKLQQPEFAMILQPSFFHGSLVVNSGLNEHLLFAASKLLPYYMHVVDFFPHHPITTIFFYKITNFLVIHFLKGTYKFCWCINEICSIDLIIPTIPLCLMKRLKLKMNKSVLVEWTTSPYFLTSFQLFFCHKWLRNINTICNWWFCTHPIFWQICHLLLLKFSSHLIHFPIIDRTNELQLMIQKPEDLIWLMVIPWPACVTPSYCQFSSFTGLRE